MNRLLQCYGRGVFIMDEKNREISVMEDELPDTDAFEIMDVLPEEESENGKEENKVDPRKGKMTWIIIAGILVILAVIWFMLR